MVGSGGVGKSALTLQFMYDEVGCVFQLETCQKNQFKVLKPENFNACPSAKI